ncbi:glycosyl hydrolase family 47 protein [Hirsutella rhossiliensis]|uniref:alpha-1,2-Mannosidase n=1 Tax=Hirsutella rhossiliensis TaxID=111463 RepID=A0A9P8MP83_9HYPO|nr:glycosyl hydrolase family 47 protein [Hirsutella rhossiliensis]KAH0958614.1 glycosyl hydrolase family 47 protein [Hirsutella rhossiliensis]
MRFTTGSLLLLELATTVLAVPEKAEAVKRAFEISWEGYYNYSFPHDTLHPVSNGFEDDRNGWGVTVVDALSTAIIMGETGIIHRMLDHIAKIDFTTTARPDDRISLFETNIRYLGGLISGYDLLKGPMRNLKLDSRKVQTLLKQAESLADTLSFAFDTPSGIPDSAVFLNPSKRTSGSNENSLAEAGTLVLEWTRLSDLTGNPNPEPWPGLVGNTLSTADGSFLNSDGGWSGGTDSFYEYLMKMYQYDPEAYGEYKERWVLAADSTMKHLASHPTSRKDLTYLSQFSGQTLDPVSTHLASFAGGSFILGGVVLNEAKYKKFGLELAESYFNNYRQSPSGIGPEVFSWVDATLPRGGGNNNPPQSQRQFYEKSGFYTTAGSYILRPETLESIYYAYRLTGDDKWQKMAWQAFGSISKACRTGSGYAELRDVMQPDGGGFYDQMQSFWMAETLKYLYLIFADESEVQLQLQGGAKSKFVFNTEAHPLRIRG